MCDYLAYCLDDPETSSVILFVEGFKRPERFLALADRALELGKPIMAVKVGRSDQAQAAAMAHSGLARGRDAGHRCGARRGRGHPLPRPRRAARDGRARRGRPADRPAGRPRPDGRRDRVDRRGVAHRRPRAADRPGPAARPRLGAGRHPRGAADDGLHRQPARSVGRGRPRRRPTAPPSRRWPRRAPTTCWSSSTTSRTARWRPRSPRPTR